MRDVQEANDDWLGELAAAVADGRTVDWDSVESSARDDDERGAVRRLRALAAIGRAYGDLILDDSVTDSLSVRALLHGTDDPSEPITWGPLRILERVGRGRFGDVYRAWDPSLDRVVALKLLRQRDSESTSDREVIEEGRLMARVRHPNVVTIHGAQRIDGRTGLWMEFIEGRTLETELKDRGPFPAAEIVEIGIQLCRALGAVHDAGLVHRDVKAQNVLRDPHGRVVLGDFGTGYDVEDADAVPTALTGTPVYLAPEIFEGCTASIQSDIYSLGVLLFRLCTNAYPVPSTSLRDLRAAHKAQRRTSLATVRPTLPQGLTATIEQAMAATPQGRYQSASNLEAALAATLPMDAVERGWLKQAVVGGAIATALGGLAWWDVARRPPANPVVRPAAIAVPVPAAMTALAQNEPAEALTLAAAPALSSSPSGTVADISVITNPRTFRRIAGDELSFELGAPSRDGRLFAATELDGQLAVIEVGTGQKLRLTGQGLGESPCHSFSSCPDGRVTDPRFSRDGSGITYVRGSSQVGSERMRPEIRRIPVAGGPSRVLWRSADIPPGTGPGLTLYHSAGDDDLILAGKWSGTSRELMIVSAETGRIVASYTAPRTVDSATLSPDGRFVAYDFVEASSGLRDIDIWTVGTNGATALVHGIASDRAPMWTADGKYVLFVSSRSGANALWAQRIEAGHVVGPPVRVDPDIGDVALLGTTNTGALIVRRNGAAARDVYTVAVDPHTLTAMTQPRRLSTRSVGTAGLPAWSRDGNYVAYTRVEDDRFTIVVKSMADGREREFPAGLTSAHKLLWEPDGRSLLFRGIANGVQALYRFTIETGQLSTVWQRTFFLHEILPQSGLLLFVHVEGGSSTITLNNLETGAETLLRRSPGSTITTLLVSPSGDSAVYSELTAAGPVVQVLDLTAPYTSRVLLSGTSRDDLSIPVLWTTDGQQLLVRRPVDETGKPFPPSESRNRSTFWAVNVRTGEMRPVLTQLGALLSASISPDGRQLAIEVGSTSATEVWALESVLATLPR